jgi:hypothetical protein
MRNTTEKTQAFVCDLISKLKRQNFKNNLFFNRNIAYFKTDYVQCHAKFSHVSIRARADEARFSHLLGVCGDGGGTVVNPYRTNVENRVSS